MELTDFIVIYKWFFIIGVIFLIFIIIAIRINKPKKEEDYNDEEDQDASDEEEPEEEDDDEKYTYNAEHECENCGVSTEFDIPVGTTLQEFVQGKKCETCECKLI